MTADRPGTICREHSIDSKPRAVGIGLASLGNRSRLQCTHVQVAADADWDGDDAQCRINTLWGSGEQEEMGASFPYSATEQ